MKNSLNSIRTKSAISSWPKQYLPILPKIFPIQSLQVWEKQHEWSHRETLEANHEITVSEPFQKSMCNLRMDFCQNNWAIWEQRMRKIIHTWIAVLTLFNFYVYFRNLSFLQSRGPPLVLQCAGLHRVVIRVEPLTLLLRRAHIFRYFSNSQILGISGFEKIAVLKGNIWESLSGGRPHIFEKNRKIKQTIEKVIYKIIYILFSDIFSKHFSKTGPRWFARASESALTFRTVTIFCELQNIRSALSVRFLKTSTSYVYYGFLEWRVYY